MKENTCEVIPFPQLKPKTQLDPLDFGSIWVVLVIDKYNGKVEIDTVWSSENKARSYLLTKGEEYKIEYEIEEHVVDYFGYFE